MQEIYKDIVGYEGLYQVSNLGNVKSFNKDKNGILLKPGVDRDGYLYVNLRKNNTSKSVKVHRLVAMAFIPNLENKEQVNHINGVKTDNTLSNLEWCTAKENIQHSYNNGLSQKGEKHYKSKLTNEQVLKIRNDVRTHQKIANDYNVSQRLISYIKRGKIWKHI